MFQTIIYQNKQRELNKQKANTKMKSGEEKFLSDAPTELINILTISFRMAVTASASILAAV